jgi:4-hydroxy-3-methylbut-2-en-1-yl diphosphate reductase
MRPPQTERLAYVTQTTLSVDDTREIAAVLRRRFPDIQSSKKDDICCATTNRQRAVKHLLGSVDLLLVIGSRNSSNSNRLVEVARAGGVAAHLIDDERAIEEVWLEGVETIGLTSGASAPESLVRRVVGWFRARGVTEVDEIEAAPEDIAFRLPLELRGLTSS